MRLNARDYYSSISFFGLFICHYGFYRLVIEPRYELVGGIQIITGIFLMVFGLMFLLSSSRQELGMMEMALDRLVRRLLYDS